MPFIIDKNWESFNSQTKKKKKRKKERHEEKERKWSKKRT